MKRTKSNCVNAESALFTQTSDWPPSHQWITSTLKPFHFLKKYFREVVPFRRWFWTVKPTSGKSWIFMSEQWFTDRYELLWKWASAESHYCGEKSLLNLTGTLWEQSWEGKLQKYFTACFLNWSFTNKSLLCLFTSLPLCLNQLLLESLVLL